MRFVSPLGGSAFIHELLGVVAHEVSVLGVPTTVSRGAYPENDSDDVYVVVPHEYFAVTPRRWFPNADQLRRTVAFCVEHPGNQTFETSTRWAATAGAVVDINGDSTAELQKRGIAAERFVLGYSSAWDAWHGDDGVDRDIDVAYLGTAEPRRARVLTSYAETLAPYTVRLLIPPWRDRLTRARPDFLLGSAKFEWLCRSQILLNLHRGHSYSLEWVRVLEALCNGCVVVSEHSIDYAPLVPGRHIVFGHWRNLAHLTDTLLAHPDQLDHIRRDAYDWVRSDLQMQPSVARLVSLADDLRSGPIQRIVTAPASRAPLPAVLAGTEYAGEVYGRASVPEMSDTARPTLARSIAPPFSVPRFDLRRRPRRAAASVDVLLVEGVGDPSPLHTAVNVLEQFSTCDLHVRVVTSALHNGGLRAAFIHERRVTVSEQTEHGVVGAERNRLLAASDGDYLLVLEPIDSLLPGALAQLVACLRADSSLAACYPFCAEPDGELGNAHPFEADRLATLDYLRAPALWRRDALIELGGWCDQPDFESLENYDLWRRLAASGGRAELVPQILVRRRDRPIRLLRPADVDPERFAHLLDDRSAFTESTPSV